MSPALIGRSCDVSVSPSASHRAMVSAMRFGEPRRRRHRHAVAERRPGIGDLGVLRPLHRPDLDQARLPLAQRDMAQAARRPSTTPGVRAGSAKTRSTASSSGTTVRNDSCSGTRRHVDAGVARRSPRSARRWRRTSSAPRPGSCRSTASRRRPRTACAARSALPAPAKNSAASASTIAPLQRARVLRLVDEDVVEAAVELEEHPGGCRRRRRAGARCARIRSSKSSAARCALAAREALQHVTGEPEQRERRLEQHAAPRRFRRAARSRLRRASSCGVEIGMRGGERLGHQALARLALAGAARASPAPSIRAPAIGAASTARRTLRRLHDRSGRRRCRARRAAAPDRRRVTRRRPMLVSIAARVVVRREPEQRAIELLGAGDSSASQSRRSSARHRCEPVAAGRARRRSSSSKPSLGGEGDRRLQRACRAPSAARRVASISVAVDRLAAQRARRLVVEDREARRHARLERKALQQALAEGVDGLHLEAAGRLDRAREQRARALAARRGAGSRPSSFVSDLSPGRRFGSGHPRRRGRSNTRFDISAAAALV